MNVRVPFNSSSVMSDRSSPMRVLARLKNCSAMLAGKTSVALVATLIVCGCADARFVVTNDSAPSQIWSRDSRTAKLDILRIEYWLYAPARVVAHIKTRGLPTQEIEGNYRVIEEPDRRILVVQFDSANESYLLEGDARISVLV